MPEITRFFGIIIRMFTETGERHHNPHLHAYYQDQMAVFALDPGKLISGKIPRRQQRLVGSMDGTLSGSTLRRLAFSNYR